VAACPSGRATGIAIRGFRSTGTVGRRVRVRVLAADRARLHRAHDEVDLDAVAHDPPERLGDQRAVAGLQPVLGKAVRHRDPEARVIDLEEGRVTQPRLEVRGRESDLELAEGRAPDLLRVHGSMWTLSAGGRWN